MAKTYSGGVKVATPFKMEDAQPIVDYMVVDLVDDLDTIPNQFIGMKVFVLEDQRDWTKKAIGWVPELTVNLGLYRQKIEKAANQLSLEAETEHLIINDKTTYLFANGGETATIKYLLKIVDDIHNYDGREYTFINKQSTPITFKDNDPTVEPLAIKFDFGGEDFVLETDQVFTLKFVNFLGKLIFMNASKKDFDAHKKFPISVSQTTNIVMIGYKERVTITALDAITNVDSFSEFVVYKGDVPMTTRTTITEVNTDILSLSAVEIAAGYTVKFKINLIPGESNASAILISQKI